MARQIDDLIGAIDRMASAGFAVGPEWAAAHELCQAHEGEQVFDWCHALCHRVEGDDANASYWYRRAAKPVATGSLVEEWRAMKAVIAPLG